MKAIKKNKLLFVVILFDILFVLVIFSPSWAATYYVDATNGNDSNSGISESAPWKTIAEVNHSDFNPGDQILFKRGETWIGTTLNIPSDGKSGNHITIGAYGTGNKPIIDGSGLGKTIYLNGRGFITINNLEIKKGGVVIFLTSGGTNGQIIITNCDIHDSETNNNISIKDRGNITIENCTVYNSAGNGISAYTSGTPDWGDRTGDNVTVSGSTIYNNSKSGLFVFGDGAVVQNNEIYSNGIADEEGKYHNIYISGDNALVQKNILRDAVYGDGIRFLGSNLTARYNFIHHNRKHGFGIWNDYSVNHSNLAISYNLLIQRNYTETPVSRPMTINISNAAGAGSFHNIKIYNNSVYGENDNANGFSFNNCSDLDIKNNILYLKDAYLMLISPTASVISDYNMFKSDKTTPFFSRRYATFSQWQGDGYGRHSIENDPDFTDPINNNLTLQSTSPAIDAGTNIGSSYDDGLHPNSTLPNGVLTLDQDNFGQWEIGAYVYQGRALLSAPINFRTLFQ